LTGIRDAVAATLHTYHPDRLGAGLEPTTLEDVRLLITPQTKQRAQRLIWSNDLHRPLPLPGAPVRQALLNLLLNASAATPVGGTVAVEIDAADRGVVRLTVRDEGAGPPADDKRRAGGAETDAVAEQQSEGAARPNKRRLAGGGGLEECAMHAGHRAVGGGNGGDQGRPLGASHARIGPVDNTRMESQSGFPPSEYDAASGEIARGQVAGEEPGRREQALRGGGGIGGNGLAGGRWTITRQTQEGGRFVERRAKIQAPVGGNHIEQVAAFRGRGVDPFSGTGAGQADIETAAGRAAHVADLSIGALAPAGGKVCSADRLGLDGKAGQDLGKGHGGVLRQRNGPADHFSAIRRHLELVQFVGYSYSWPR
jgi:hypothetical protein